MSNDLERQIKVMQHYANGGEVEILTNGEWNLVVNRDFANWNFGLYDFRIKEQKKTVTIEKWLIEHTGEEYRIVETSNISLYVRVGCKKIKLLDTYEVEL